MRKPKHAIEVLPSKEELALDRLAEAVLQRIANKSAAAEVERPETDAELSESVLVPAARHRRGHPQADSRVALAEIYLRL